MPIFVLMKKESVQRTLEQLPDEFHLDELIERLLVIAKIEEALEAVEKGEVVDHEEVVKQFRHRHETQMD